MAVRKIQVLLLRCNRCGYEWVTREKKLPTACSGCKSTGWNTRRGRGRPSIG